MTGLAPTSVLLRFPFAAQDFVTMLSSGKSLAIGTMLYATLKISISLFLSEGRVFITVYVDYPRKYYSLHIRGQVGVLDYKDALYCKKEFDCQYQSSGGYHSQVLGQPQTVENYVSDDGKITVGFKIAQTTLDSNLYDQDNKMYELLDTKFGDADRELDRVKEERDRLMEQVTRFDAERARMQATADKLGIALADANARLQAYKGPQAARQPPGLAQLEQLGDAASAKPGPKPAGPAGLEERIREATASGAVGELIKLQERLTHLLTEVAAAIKEASLCKVCLAAAADTIILDCGHLCCCQACASAVRAGPTKTCPICRGPIRMTVLSYKT